MPNGNVFSVTQINEYIKMTLESSPVLNSVFLCGEISNFKSNYASGHLYFSLKDEGSSIRAVMFRGYASRLRFRVESGMKVIVHGKISTYTVSGDYQIIIDDMQPDGAGALAVAFEQLKRKLSAEGLFDEDRKKPIPRFAKTVGVVTSASGAALHDIINVSGRRNPSAHIIVYPSYVQGELAPQSLAGGIRFFNLRHKVDVIIIGRGGGSAEDLWCFNDEMLARAIAESEIPVISAVGHETDFTICDFVADMRAPTPSAAAELAFFDANELLMRVDSLYKRASMVIDRNVRMLDGRIDALCKDVQMLSPEKVTDDKILRVQRMRERLDAMGGSRVESACGDLRTLCARLEGINPLAVLSRGYSMVQTQGGEIVSRLSDVEEGDTLTVRMSDGDFSAKVIQKNG